MKAERQKLVARFQTEGEREAKIIKANADGQANEILAKAKAEAIRITGEAETKLLSITPRSRRIRPRRLPVPAQGARTITEGTHPPDPRPADATVQPVERRRQHALRRRIEK